MSTTHVKQMNECVVAIYDAIAKAEAAVDRLHRAGFADKHVSLIKRHLDPNGEIAAQLKADDDSLREAAIGGALGSLAGLVGAAALLSITGFGLILVTGPLVALTGSIVGGLLGAMSGWGVHESNIREYERLVETGKVLVVVAGDPPAVEKAENLLKETGAERVRLHAPASDDSPEVDDRPKR